MTTLAHFDKSNEPKKPQYLYKEQRLELLKYVFFGPELIYASASIT